MQLTCTDELRFCCPMGSSPPRENDHFLDRKMEETSNHNNIEVDEAAAPEEISTNKPVTDHSMDCTQIDIKGSSRGYLLWKTFRNIRKYVSKVSEPLTKGQRRSLRRQLSFQVDDLERITLGVKPREEENSDAAEVSVDEEMRGEVEAIVKDAIEKASSAGKVVNMDCFENRIKEVEKECVDLKKKLEEMSHRSSEPKRKKPEKASTLTHPEKASGSFFMIQKSPYKSSKSGYGSDDHGYEGSLDFTMEQDESSKAKKETKPSPCAVCGKLDVLNRGWRCVSCRNFWSRLTRLHARGKLLPLCNHWEPAAACKGCRRRKYESAMTLHCPYTPLGIPPCPPPLCPVEESLIKEESREIQIEYW